MKSSDKMDFKKITQISTVLSKSFAENFFKLLVVYKDISASEAASRLDLHIKTAQDFLDELNALQIVSKKEVFEKKRPYFRYSLKQDKITLEVDFKSIHNSSEDKNKLKQKIRERKNAGAMFSIAGNNSFISAVTVFVGEGRKRKERKISLTHAQGKFLYHLPFPNSPYLTIQEVADRAYVDQSFINEIIDIVEVLKEFRVIEYSP